MFMCKYERYESGNKVQAITSRLVAVLTITDVDNGYSYHLLSS